MVDCYIALHKMRNALTAASNCCKQMNHHPKALTVSLFDNSYNCHVCIILKFLNSLLFRFFLNIINYNFFKY